MAQTRWLTDDEQRTWRAFLEATRRLDEQLDRELQHQAGLPLGYYTILVMLSEAPQRTLRMSELAQRTWSSRSRLSHAVDRLEEKGYVKRHVEGRTNVYRVSEPPRNLAVTAVQQIIDRLCGGSVEQLIVGMVDRELLDERELRRLAEKLARRKNRTQKERDAD